MADSKLQQLLKIMRDMPTPNGTLLLQANRNLNSSTQRPNFESTCNHCKKPASVRCAGCIDAPTFGDESSCIMYCNSVCQKADYVNHKSICRSFRARKALYRAGDILQESFYLFREILFDKRIIKIEEKDGKVYLYEPIYSNKLKTRVDCLEKFASHLYKSDAIKKGVLVFMTCTDAVGWMYAMTKYLLEDVAIHIEERAFEIKNSKLKLAAIDHTGWEDPTDYEHYLLKVSIKPQAEEYVVDLSGAQYGWKETVMPFSEFASTRMKKAMPKTGENANAHGAQRENLLILSRQQGAAAAVFMVNAYVSEELQPAVVKWEREMKMKVKEILQLPADDFGRAKECLLGLVKKGLSKALADLDSPKTLRLPLPGGQFGLWKKPV